MYCERYLLNSHFYFPHSLVTTKGQLYSKPALTLSRPLCDLHFRELTRMKDSGMVFLCVGLSPSLSHYQCHAIYLCLPCSNLQSLLYQSNWKTGGTERAGTIHCEEHSEKQPLFFATTSTMTLKPTHLEWRGSNQASPKYI